MQAAVNTKLSKRRKERHRTTAEFSRELAFEQDVRDIEISRELAFEQNVLDTEFSRRELAFEQNVMDTEFSRELAFEPGSYGYQTVKHIIQTLVRNSIKTKIGRTRAKYFINVRKLKLKT